MMGDKKALQAGTSHNLGTNFAKAFNTTFLDADGAQQFVHQSSWGVSTRMVGGVIMTHGDDVGLRLPPALAPIQVVVVPIFKTAEEAAAVNSAAESLTATLIAAGVRVKLDADQTKTPGWKYNFYEMKGVPIRIEVGPRDVAANACAMARRDRPGKAGKEFGVSLEPDVLVSKVHRTLAEVQASLLDAARVFRDANIIDVRSMDELRAVIAAGQWARAGWEGSDAQEKEIKEALGATIRCFPFDQPPGPHICIATGKLAKEVCIFAKSY